jgi:hypothetical protein
VFKDEKVKKMVLKNLQCFHCKTLNCADVSEQKPEIVIFCKNCGFAFNPDPEMLKRLNDPNPGNFLPCIPLKGVAAREPLGETVDGYIDPVMGGSQPHSRQEYMDMFFIDPAIYLDWLKVRKSPRNVSGFECKENTQPKAQPCSSVNDPAKLKQEQLAGKITRKIYLENLKCLLESGKVTQAYYDQEKKRIISEI